MALKYLVLEVPDGEAPVLFGREYFHAFMATRFEPARVIAAGFVRLTDKGPECYGTSTSLRIGSRRAEDAALIARHLRGRERR